MVRIDRIRTSIVLAGIFAIALVFSHDSWDVFRLPKTLLLQAEAILLVGVTLAAILFGARVPRPRWSDPAVAVPLIAFATMIVVTITSTHPALSVKSLGPAAATLVVFFATVAAARDRAWIFVGVPLAAAVVNAILVVLEETHLWMPFGEQAGVSHHLQCTALVGNPNEVGSYLGAAALAGIAAWPTRRTVAPMLIIGLIASRTMTAMIAFAAGVVVMVAISSWKKAIRAAAVAAIAGAILIAVVAPLRHRAGRMVRLAQKGDYNALLTDRVTPFVAASLMFADHPLTGVGPGAFAWHYYDYKLRAQERLPSLRGAWNRGVNYGEVHNDHLQVLAEGGILGYAAFLVAIGALAAISFTIPADASDARQQFARRLAASLAVFWLVLSLAQFPLETPVVRSLLIHFAAVCVAWRSS